MLAELLQHTISIEQIKLTKNQLYILEAALFVHVCEELSVFYFEKYKAYFSLTKTINQEGEIMDEMLAKCVVNDILNSEEYTLSGIAYYVNASEDVVYDLAIGQNRAPSSTLLKKIIKLHQSIRPELYQEIIKKILPVQHTLNSN